MVSDPHQTERLALQRVPEVLAQAMGVERAERLTTAPGDHAYDLALTVDGRDFAVEVKGNASAPRLIEAWQQVKHAVTGRTIPVIAVVHMTGPAKDAALEHGINWIDLSGNAHIRARGFFLHIEGRPPQFAPRGRPASVFERRSSRLVRLLLVKPGQAWTVSEAAKEAGLNPGNVSRLAARLLEDGYLQRSEGRRFVLREPARLMDAWRAASDFSAHRTFRGHLSARSGTDLLEGLSLGMKKLSLRHAATGLAAAWQYDHFAMFRLATFFVDTWPTAQTLAALGVREQPEGANVWLTVPNDDGVFRGEAEVDGIPCVHPLQAWIDLKGQPERAEEAAVHLREGLLNGRFPT